MTTKVQIGRTRRATNSAKNELVRRIETVRKTWNEREERLRRKIALAMQNQLLSALGKASHS